MGYPEVSESLPNYQILTEHEFNEAWPEIDKYIKFEVNPSGGSDIRSVQNLLNESTVDQDKKAELKVYRAWRAR